jgi:factor associated with neutral sphingomyelinase activation
MAARRSRFNLLLLEEGEWLLEECTAHMFICKPQTESQDYSVDSFFGRLRLCTRGIFFEPDDHRSPITKFSFRNCPGCPISCVDLPLSAAISAATASERLDRGKLFTIQSQIASEMKVNNVIAPYKSVVLSDLSPSKDVAASPQPTARTRTVAGPARKQAATVVGPLSHVTGRTTVLFALQHASVASIVPLAQQLWSIQQQCASGAHSSFERAALCPILDARREGPFDISLLSDYRERPLLPSGPMAVYAERVFPLVVCPGRIMVTERAGSERIVVENSLVVPRDDTIYCVTSRIPSVYLLPVAINCVAGSDAVYKWPLKDVRRVLRRRRLLRETGLELILTESAAAAFGASGDAAGLGSRLGAASGVFLAFTTPAVRDSVYRCILKV